jgi:putative ABC transport system permease protein
MRLPIWLILRNLTHFWRTNLAVIAGVGIAVAVLAGALIVGASVRASLRELALGRLGAVDHVVAAGAFFREALAEDLAAHPEAAGAFGHVAPIIELDGFITHQASGRRASRVQVFGVDSRFWDLHGRRPPALDGRSGAALSESLAHELGVEPEDILLIRTLRPSAIPLESLHGRKDDVGRTLRVSADAVVGHDNLGEFSLRPHQGPVRAIFVPLGQLQAHVEQDGRVNTILLGIERREHQRVAGGAPASTEDADGGSRAGEGSRRSSDPLALLERAVQESATLEDFGLRVRPLPEHGVIVLEAEGGVLGDLAADAGVASAEDLGWEPQPILTYLANTMRANEREVPYSLITALDLERLALPLETSEPTHAVHRADGQAAEVRQDSAKEDAPPMILNAWAARDLAASPGDAVTIDYYVWTDGGLLTRPATFRLAGIVPIRGIADDRDLAPRFPGITDADNLSDWDPPFPIDLRRIRPRDEEYWDWYRTTPKAFIPLETGQNLWRTRYGGLTSLRVAPLEGIDLRQAALTYEDRLRGTLDPAASGLMVRPVRAQALEAATGTTDFGEYFTYFSFFLVAAALLLGSLFFKLGIEQRLREIGILRAIGFRAANIRSIFFAEGVVLAVIGSVLGVIGAVAYGALIMYGLRTWWVDAVGTTLLRLHISGAALALGAAAGIGAALLCIYWTLRGLAHVSPRSLVTGSVDTDVQFLASPVRRMPAALALGAVGALVLAAAAAGVIGQVIGFFVAGTLLLVTLLLVLSARLRRSNPRLLHGTGWKAVSRLGFRNAAHRPARSVLCVTLIAAATFIIVAVDAFRRDEGAVLDRHGATGGFPLMAESMLPIVHDPETSEGRGELNLTADALADVRFARFRLRPGDDASCLNLYRPTDPRILAPADAFLQDGRFSFRKALAETPEERENPWLLLDRDLPDGAIPVIGDANSLRYVMHLDVGDTFVLNPDSARPIALRVVAALDDSVFQSELLMSERNFVRLFPEHEGYRVFLIEMDDVPLPGTPMAGDRQAAVATELEDRLSDFGVAVSSTAERLAAYHRVENTYLSTFQMLGALGIVLGTFGLATVLLRNVLERRRELALLRAVGYNHRHFSLMVAAENAFLLVWGLAAGTVCAVVAITPAAAERGAGFLNPSLAWILLAIVATGMLASVVATAAALRSPLIPALRSE